MLFIKQDDGSFVDAATGKPAPDVMASGLKQVRMNNPVRGAVDAALGSLRLFAPDPSTRLDAAEAVFHSHDPAALPALDKALAKETDAGVKAPHGAGACRGYYCLTQTARKPIGWRPWRYCAPAAIWTAARCSMGCRTNRRRSKAAAAAAIASIDRVLQTLEHRCRASITELSLGSVLLLAAAGLAITFGVMGVINMAHGEMVMLGAYVTFMVQQAIRECCTRAVRRVAADLRAAGVHRCRHRSASSSNAP